MRLQVPRRHAGQRNAVMVAQFDERVTVRVLGDQRRQLLNVQLAKWSSSIASTRGLKFTTVSAPTPGVNAKVSPPTPPTETDVMQELVPADQ
jgi:hypothetical protein